MFFFFKQNTSYEVRISDWSSYVCSSDLLVGLDDHPVAGAEARIRSVGVDDAAVDNGGVEPGTVQQGRHHGGGCGLAVGAADGDRPFEAHQLAQHLGDRKSVV